MNYAAVCNRQGSSKSNRSNRSDRRPSGHTSPKLYRHPSLRFSVKQQSTSGSAAIAGGSRNDDIHGSADPYAILTTLHQQARSSSFKSSPVDFSPPYDVMAAVGLSPRGSRKDLTKAVIGTQGYDVLSLAYNIRKRFGFDVFFFHG